ncbi:MAG: SprB repeat-containing protein, partial [Betaproteobacteria bacterium]
MTQPAIALSASITGESDVLCYGGSTGSATAAGADGTPGYTYSWDNGQTNATATGLTAGTYFVTVTDANSCTTATSVIVGQPTAALTASIAAQTDVLCYGGSNGAATAAGDHGTPGYTYAWDNGQNVATATGLTSGTYVVTVTDANSCTTTTSVLITQPAAALWASITGKTDVRCNGTSTGDATASGNDGTAGYTYLWSNGQSSATAVGLGYGTYYVTVTDSHNCTATTSVTLSQPTAMSDSPVITDVTCHDKDDGIIDPGISGGTPFPGGPPDYLYLWSDAQTDPIHTGCKPINYSVTVTDANSCTHVFGPYSVTQPDEFKFDNVITPVTCYGGSDGSITSVHITGGTLPYSYLWSTGETTSDISGLTAATYSVVGTDARG